MKKSLLTTLITLFSIYNGFSQLTTSTTTNNATCFSACDGNATVTVLTGIAPYTYLWNDGASQTTATANNLCAGTYMVIVTDVQSQTDTAYVNITQPTPMSTNHTPIDPMCFGGSDGSVTATVTGGVAPFMYSWSNGATTPNIGSLSAGTYTLTVTDANGCTTSANAVINNPAPIIVDAGADQTICEGSVANLTANVTGGSAPYTYNWTPSSGLSSTTTPNVSASPASTTAYSISVTDAMGCLGSGSVTVNISPLPVITISTNSPVCQYGMIAFSASAIGGVNYSWTGPSGYSSSVLSPTIVNADITSAGTYTLTSYTAAGCIASASTNVTVNLAPTANAGPDQTVCSGSAAALDGSGSSGATSYQWTPSTYLDNPNIVNPSASAMFSSSYTLVVTNAVGCSDTAFMNLTVNVSPAIDAGPDQTICPGTSANLSGNGGVVYTWGPMGATTVSVSVSPIVTTAYSLMGQDAVGCSGYDTVVVSVSVAPTANAGADQTVCEGDNIALFGNGGVNYYWSTPTGGTAATQSYNVSIASANDAGLYVLQVMDALGCIGSDSVIVIVNALPNITATSNSPVCENDMLSLSASGGVSYSWSGPNGFTSNTSLPNLTATPLVAGTYNLSIVGANGCPASTSTNVVVNNAPVVNAGADMNVCPNTAYQIGSSSNVGITYSWSPTANLSSATVSNPVYQFTSFGTATYILTATTSSTGCANSDTVNFSEINYANIHGIITVNGTPVSSGSGTVYAYSTQCGLLGATFAPVTTTIGAGGAYSFNYITACSYIIKVELDTIAYPNAIPTYSPTATTWATADTVIVNCNDTAIANIAVVELAPMIGQGVISGQVIGGNGPLKTWQQGDPIPGVDVSLEQNPGSVMSVTSTDNNGNYSFVNVPVGNYTIYVDVPGLDMSATYGVSITSNTNDFNNAIFYVDSTGSIDTVRTLVMGIHKQTIVGKNVVVYPNPFAGTTNISYELLEKSNVNIEVYNVIGEKVATLVNTNKDAGKYNELFSTKNNDAGIYFVKININGNVQTVRLIKTN